MLMFDLPPPFGDDLPGGYRLLRRLGRGAYGEVWCAEAPGGVEVAIKIIPRALRPAEAQRELDGLHLIKRLRHPFLLGLQGFFAQEERLIIVLALAEQNLRQRLHECRRAGEAGIPAGELLRYIKEAAEALDYLHANNVLHRDVKPDNLLLLGGHVQVADYGLARALENTSLHLASMVGTPAYMPPEIWEGKGCGQSDQYSLAVTYAEMRLGRVPINADNLMQMAHHQLHVLPDLDGLGPAEQEVLRRALAKAAPRRFPTCRDFARALGRAVAEDSARQPVGAALDASLLSFEGSTLTGPEPPPLPPLVPPEPAEPLSLLAPSTALAPLQVPFPEVPAEATGHPLTPLTDHPGGLLLPVPRETTGPSAQRETIRAESDPVEVSCPPQKSGPRVPTGKSWHDPESEPPPSRLRLVLLVGCMLVAVAGVLIWKAPDWFAEETPPVVKVPGPVEPPILKGDGKDDKDDQGPPPVVKPPVQAVLRLSAGETLTLEEGKSGLLEVTVQRENGAGPVSLKLEGLPPGVRAPTVSLPADRDRVAIKLEAADGAAVGSREITVRAALRNAAGEPATVQAARSLRLTVTAGPPLRLLALAPVAAQSGQTRVVGVRVQRRRHQGPIELRLEGLPEGVRSWPNSIPAGRNAGAVALNVGNAPTGSTTVRVLAVAGARRTEGEFLVTIRPAQPLAAWLAEDGEAIQGAPADPVPYLNRGHTHRELGEYARALEDCTTAVKLGPDYPVAHVSRGLVHLARREHDEALKDFDRALELSPGYVPAQLNRGLAHVGKRAYDRALADFTAVIDRDGANVSAWANRANAHRLKGDYEQALRDCDKAIELDPKQAHAFNVRGLVRAARKDLTGAIADYDAAIKREPAYLFPRYNRGLAYAALKKYDQAVSAFGEAIDLDRKFAPAYHGRANAFYHQGDYTPAIGDFGRAAALDGRFEKSANRPLAHFQRGLARFDDKDHDGAIEDYTAALRLRPDYAPAHYKRGNVYLAREQYDRALKDYDDAIRLKQDYAYAYHGRGNVHFARQDYERALQDYDKAVRLSPDNAAHYNNRGNAHRARKDLDLALQDYTKAIKLKPDYAHPYHGRGVVHFERRELDSALRDFHEALRLDPQYALAYHGRGNVHLERKDLDRAIEDYTRAIQFDGENPIHYNNRGVAYRRKEDLGRALQDYTKAIALKPDYAHAYHARGNVHFARKQYDQAIKDLSEAIRLDAKNPVPYNDRGAAHSARGDHERAIQDYTSAIERNEAYALAYANRCLAHRARGDLGRARQDRATAVRLDRAFDQKLPR
jgi:tetratricopeptide (TPR) repeat protein/serine/threonine protein kinase